MKIWVCRDGTGSAGKRWYILIGEDCKPKREVGAGGNSFWCCRCKGRTHSIDIHADDGFKKKYGLKRHLKPGAKKLMTWTLPLARQPKEKK